MADDNEKTPRPVLQKWLKRSTKGQRDAVADLAGTSLAYLYQIAGGHARASAEMAKAIETAVAEITPDRQVDRAHLRPDLWENTGFMHMDHCNRQK